MMMMMMMIYVIAMLSCTRLSASDAVMYASDHVICDSDTVT